MEINSESQSSWAALRLGELCERNRALSIPFVPRQERSVASGWGRPRRCVIMLLL